MQAEPELGATLKQRGRALKLEGHYAEAKEVLENAVEATATWKGPERYEMAEVLVELGDVHQYLGEFTQAEEIAKHAFVIASKHSDKFLSLKSNPRIWALEVFQKIDKAKGIPERELEQIESELLQSIQLEE
ncbi:MAG: tetratricopeptide repeat protein [Verrucomicrobiota bacterium]